MAKDTKIRSAQPDDPIFSSGPQTFVPASKPSTETSPKATGGAQPADLDWERAIQLYSLESHVGMLLQGGMTLAQAEQSLIKRGVQSRLAKEAIELFDPVHLVPKRALHPSELTDASNSPTGDESDT